MITVAKKRENTAFGERLRVLRIAAGLSQSLLGEMSGVDANSIARFERGEREPTWPTVLKLAEALGVKADDFRETE